MSEESIEICTISQEEIIYAIEVSLEIENIQGDEKWAEKFQIFTPLKLSLKELTLMGMKQIIPRNAIDFLADVLSLNIPIDALEAVQNRGKTAIPNYRAIAYIFFNKLKEHLAEAISVQKDICKQQRISDQALLSQLVRIIIKRLNIPISGAGIAAVIALVFAKTEFDMSLDEK